MSSAYSGTLFIVATPIGNLEDITSRALKTLKEVDLILAEDTRVTKKLLTHYDIQTPTLSYHQHSGLTKKMEVLKLLLEGKNIVLVTDAGTPGISDPGNELIDFLLNNKVPFEKEPLIDVIPVPGPSALTAALSISGFRSDKFIFLGFLPKKKKEKLFSWLEISKMTFVFFERGERLAKTLAGLKKHFRGETRVLVARELTKLHEEKIRGSIEAVIKKVEELDKRGEVVVVVESIKKAPFKVT